MKQPSAVIIRECRDGQSWKALDPSEIPAWFTREIVDQMLYTDQLVHDSIDGADIYYKAHAVRTQADEEALAAAEAKRQRKNARRIGK
jgi:hypothetical protein